MEVGGGLILNALLLQTLQSNMYKGEFMERFLNVKGAASRPDLQYIPDAMWFQWLQFQQGMLQQQAQAEASMQQEPPEKPKKRPEDPAKAKEQDAKDEHEAALGEHQQQQAQAQAQSVAVDRFIQANPELFKSLQENLAKVDSDREANTDHIEKLRDGLIHDFERGANVLVKEILEAIKEDVGERDDDKETK
jgi:hypothetical protein